MKIHLYKIECLTNLHVGSGEVNYSIIDNEVEKDIDKYPIIHSSGLKGALREHAEKNQYNNDTKAVERIFGQTAGTSNVIPGSYKFFDANIISRPMRVSGNESIASISVISIATINNFLNILKAFNMPQFSNVGCIDKTLINFGDFNFMTNVSNIYIEGEKAGELSEPAKEELNKLSGIIGDNYAIVKDMNRYSLPILARNYLENGISKNLWYEEVVPHGSVFYTIIITPQDNNELDMNEIKQIGGHASIGYGFTKFTELE